jgi:hypothetical protein
LGEEVFAKKTVSSVLKTAVKNKIERKGIVFFDFTISTNFQKFTFHLLPFQKSSDNIPKYENFRMYSNDGCP